MAGMGSKMKPLLEMRERSLLAIRDLEHKVANERLRLQTIDEMIAAVKGEALPAERQVGGRLRNTKRTVMDIIHEADRAGVIASEIVERAAGHGKQLRVGSVSSLLSKLKAAGVLRFDGERYYPADVPSQPTPGLKVVGS